jgi:transcriptional regulator with GAF, ATPase, and Fis domain
MTDRQYDCLRMSSVGDLGPIPSEFLRRGEEHDLHRLLGLVVDVSPTGMLVLDEQGVILAANRRAHRDLGYEDGLLAGQPLDYCLPPHTHDGLPPPDGAEVSFARNGTTLPLHIERTRVVVEGRVFSLVSIVDSGERPGTGESEQFGSADHLAFERLIGEISADFVNIPTDALDETITSALHRIVDALDLDRAVLFLREGDDDFLPMQRWARPGVPVTAVRLSVKADFPWHWERIMAGQTAAYNRVDDIPDPVTRETVKQFGATAGITVGFSINGRVAGCVAFATVRSERQWSEAILNRLEMVGRVFAAAIARQQQDRELTAALGEVKRLGDQLKAENSYLRGEVRQAFGGTPIIGQSPLILGAQALAAQVAQTDSSVLLLGETGTGKELFAVQIHQLSSRRDRLMVRVNCAAIPDTLLESELFGREKGAYTGALTRQTGRFELADKSTIFLDEIGDLPLEVQVKLLRVLEDRQVERLGSSRSVRVDVRIIAATHRDLEAMVKAGTFREDLYYRLNVFPIRVPPLRERPADIPLLVLRFVDEFAKRFGKPVTSIDNASLADLQGHHWPGNVRELRNVVERAMIVAKAGVPLAVPLPVTAAAAVSTMAKSSKLLDVEIAHMRSVLEACGWRIRGAGFAADRLGLKPSTLETRMAKLGLRRPEKPAQ